MQLIYFNYALKMIDFYLAINDRVDCTLCQRALVEHEIECTNSNGIQEEVLISATSGFQIHVSIVNHRERWILDDDAKSGSDCVG